MYHPSKELNKFKEEVKFEIKCYHVSRDIPTADCYEPTKDGYYTWLNIGYGNWAYVFITNDIRRAGDELYNSTS